MMKLVASILLLSTVVMGSTEGDDVPDLGGGEKYDTRPSKDPTPPVRPRGRFRATKQTDHLIPQSLTEDEMQAGSFAVSSTNPVTFPDVEKNEIKKSSVTTSDDSYKSDADRPKLKRDESPLEVTKDFKNLMAEEPSVDAKNSKNMKESETFSGSSSEAGVSPSV